MEETQSAADAQNSKTVIRRPTLGDLEFRSVNFRYPDQEVDTLTRFKPQHQKGREGCHIRKEWFRKNNSNKIIQWSFWFDRWLNYI